MTIQSTSPVFSQYNQATSAYNKALKAAKGEMLTANDGAKRRGCETAEKHNI